jgi:hypothetical protein
MDAKLAWLAHDPAPHSVTQAYADIAPGRSAGRWLATKKDVWKNVRVLMRQTIAVPRRPLGDHRNRR